jgi:hypothetical protein
MKITDKTRIAHIETNFSECQDGLTITAQQAKFVLDCAMYSDMKGEETDFFVITQLENPESEVFNFTFIDADLDLKAYKVTETTAYTTREEMMQHITAFMIEKNHF